MTEMPTALADAVAATAELVDPALRKALAHLDPPMQRVCSYHLGWTDRDGVPSSGTSGKALRPTLALLSAAACHGDMAQAVPAAVGVELVHNFSLLHDDVMDGDEQRRHQPAAWAAFGVPAAVLAGDALLTLALEVVLGDLDGSVSGTVASCLVDAVGELVSGQSADLDFEGRSDVSLPEGLAMVEGKTAALLRCSAVAGALSVSAPQPALDALARFGTHLGAAFQMVDDLLGIWGTPEVTGKPAMADLQSRKKSVPVLVALASGSPAGQRLRDLYRRSEPFTPSELPEVAELVELAGGREWTQRRADREIDLAERALDGVGADRDAQATLLALAAYVTGRDR